MSEKNAPGSNATESAHTAQNSSTTRPAGYWPALWRAEPKHPADLAKRCAVFVALLDVALLALLALIVAEAVR